MPFVALDRDLNGIRGAVLRVCSVAFERRAYETHETTMQIEGEVDVHAMPQAARFFGFGFAVGFAAGPS